VRKKRDERATPTFFALFFAAVLPLPFTSFVRSSLPRVVLSCFTFPQQCSPPRVCPRPGPSLWPPRPLPSRSTSRSSSSSGAAVSSPLCRRRRRRRSSANPTSAAPSPVRSFVLFEFCERRDALWSLLIVSVLGTSKLRQLEEDSTSISEQQIDKRKIK